MRLAELKKTVNSEILTNEQLDTLLDRLFSNSKKHATNRRVIRESSTIVYPSPHKTSPFMAGM